MNNVSVTARFLLQMREPGFIEKNKRVVYSMVMLATPYLYSRAGPGVHLTPADRQDNVVVTHTLRAVCPLWQGVLRCAHLWLSVADDWLKLSITDRASITDSASPLQSMPYSLMQPISMSIDSSHAITPSNIFVADASTIYTPLEDMDSNMHLSPQMSFMLLAEIYRKTSKLAGECDERVYALIREWALEDEWHEQGLLALDPDYVEARPIRILFALEQCHGEEITEELLHEWQTSDAERHILDGRGNITSGGSSPISSSGGQSSRSRFALSSGSLTDDSVPTAAEQVLGLQTARPNFLMILPEHIQMLPGGAPAGGSEVLVRGDRG